MSKKPNFSPSKLTTYLACPVKYRWTYVDPRGKWYARAKSYYSFGTTLHRVLERLHDSEDRGVETTYQALAAMDESWLDAGYGSADEMLESQGEGKAIIEAYVEEHLRMAPTSKTIAVEKSLRWDLGDFNLIGRIDRLDEHEDGSLEIVDYKTGRNSVSEEDVASDIAMACYQLLVRKHYPERHVRASIIAVRSSQRATYAMSEEELAEFEFDLRELGRRILSHDFFELEPRPKRLCQGCDFLRLCQKHPEFDIGELGEPVDTDSPLVN